VASLMKTAPASAGTEQEGTRLLSRFECNRCHEGTGLPQLPREKNCVQCHREILAGTFPVDADTLRLWQSHLVSLPAAPSLTAVGGRLRRSFIEAFLLKPHELRPGLLAMMPRLALTPAMARSIAATLVPTEADSGSIQDGDLTAGRRLLE